MLPVEDKRPFDKRVLSFHPERSQSKVQFLIDQTGCPVSNPPPMTMIINTAERVLLIKVARMADLRGVTMPRSRSSCDTRKPRSRSRGPACRGGPNVWGWASARCPIRVSP